MSVAAAMRPTNAVADPSRMPSDLSIPLRKYIRLGRALLSGQSINRFQAARDPDIADSCLNSTICYIEALGIRIDRVPETVPGRHGIVHCHRYSLDCSPENVALAKEVFGIVTAEGAGPQSRAT